MNTTTPPNSEAPAAAANAKQPTLAENFAPRETFASLDDALTRWGVITGYPDAAEVRPFVTGMVQRQDAITEDNPEGWTIDPEVYPASHEIMIAKLSQKGDKTADAGADSDKPKSKILALVFHPIPTLETMLGLDSKLASTQATDELREILRKEMQHRAVRSLRLLNGNYTDESACIDAMDKMPQTLTEYISGSRAGSGLLEAFNKHAVAVLKKFCAIKGAHAAVGDAFKRAKLGKAELRMALSNAAFALSEHPRLEKAGLFLRVLAVLEETAKAEGLSTTVYDTWRNTRDEQTFDPTQIDLALVGDLFTAGDDDSGDDDDTGDEANA